jgi:hypothetical protein
MPVDPCTPHDSRRGDNEIESCYTPPRMRHHDLEALISVKKAYGRIDLVKIDEVQMQFTAQLYGKEAETP